MTESNPSEVERVEGHQNPSQEGAPPGNHDTNEGADDKVRIEEPDES